MLTSNAIQFTISQINNLFKAANLVPNALLRMNAEYSEL